MVIYQFRNYFIKNLLIIKTNLDTKKILVYKIVSNLIQ